MVSKLERLSLAYEKVTRWSLSYPRKVGSPLDYLFISEKPTLVECQLEFVQLVKLRHEFQVGGENVVDEVFAQGPLDVRKDRRGKFGDHRGSKLPSPISSLPLSQV